MSRSYKKPYIKDNGRSKKEAKRFANKVVRKYKDIIPNGKSYRKLYCSYNICDYKYKTYADKAYRYHIEPIWSDWEITPKREKRVVLCVDKFGFLKTKEEIINTPYYIKRLLGWEMNDDWEDLVEREKKARRK